MKTTKQQREVDIPKMVMEGATHQQVADYYGIDRAYVSRLIRYYDEATGYKHTDQLGIRRNIMTTKKLYEQLRRETRNRKDIEFLIKHCRKFYKLGYAAGKTAKYRKDGKK